MPAPIIIPPNPFYPMFQVFLSGWFLALVGFVVTAGISLLALYFLNYQFRNAYNMTFPPSGRQARYSRDGKVYRAGWAYDDGEARWRYVRPAYTRYVRDKDAEPLVEVKD